MAVPASPSTRSLDSVGTPPSPRAVLKFGGTSVSSPENWRRIARVVSARVAEGEKVLVVHSAFAGVTTLLEEMISASVEGRGSEEVARLFAIHLEMAARLGMEPPPAMVEELEWLEGASRGIALLGEASPRTRARILATGELMATRIGAQALRSHGVDAQWLDVREVLVSSRGRGDGWIRYLSATCESAPDAQFQRRLDEATGPLLTQGFVARDPGGDTVVLGRGGSDTSAAYLAARLEAVRLEIWTDVPGMFTGNPSVIPEARLLRKLSHLEAQEIATTGSKVLHPRCIPALRKAAIPVHIRSTFTPDQDGTVIVRNYRSALPQLKAISVQHDVTLVVMETVGMWQEVGFLAEVFRCFQEEGLSVDQVSTSETNVTVSLDPQGDLTSDASLERLLGRLEKYCEVRLVRGCAAVSLVGSDVRAQLHRMGAVLETFEEHRVHLMSQSANDLNLTFVVDGDRAEAIARELHEHLIGQAADPDVFGPSWAELRGEGSGSRAAPAVAAWWHARRDDLLRIAEEGGAAYVYDLATVRERARALASLRSVDRVFYAMKANWHPDVLRTVREEGLGIECVSWGEVTHAFQAIPDLETAEILFTPNFAPREEYSVALERGLLLTLDSLYPLRAWPELFRGREVLLRLDAGPGRGHHRNVRTAGGHQKFGIPLFELDDLKALLRALGCRARGLHLHAGSGVTSEEHWAETAALLGTVADELGGVEILDLGGGLGVPVRPEEAALDLARLDALLAPIRKARPERLWLEPGRYLVAEAGVLVARVTQTKGKGRHHYVGIETGMNSLIRPALYGAHHEIVNLSRLGEPASELVTVVGPICESTDRLGVDRPLPRSSEGDVLAILVAGAYGRVMSSHYNLRAPAREVVLDGTAAGGPLGGAS